jgi:ferredoxin
MLINGRTRMACSALVDRLLAEGGDEIELRPMSKFPVVRDLVVDRRRLFRGLEKVKAWVPVEGSYDLGPGPRISPEEQEDAYPLSECMSCGCCLEACPQYTKVEVVRRDDESDADFAKRRTAAFDAGLQRRLAAELEAAAAGQQGVAAPAFDFGACCRDGHGHAHHVSKVAARRRDDVPVDAADPPAPACHGDGRESRPTGTVPEGIVPSRAQLPLAAAGCSVLCTRPYHLSKVALILGPYVHFTAAELGRFAIKRRPSGWRSGPSGSDRPSDDGGTPR